MKSELKNIHVLLNRTPILNSNLKKSILFTIFETSVNFFDFDSSFTAVFDTPTPHKLYLLITHKYFYYSKYHYKRFFWHKQLNE